jgi:hypothetical protein
VKVRSLLPQLFYFDRILVVLKTRIFLFDPLSGPFREIIVPLPFNLLLFLRIIPINSWNASVVKNWYFLLPCIIGAYMAF